MRPPAATATPLLSGRHAVITGAARGLGHAIAQTFAAHGAELTVIDHPAALQASPLPEGWQAEPCDLSADGMGAALEAIAARTGRADILVANAGVVPPWRRIAALDLGEWEAVFRINVTAVAATLKAFAGHLAASPHGVAVLMASLNARRAHPDQALYTASKHAVLGLARAAALDMGRDGVRVNALGPGPVATEALLARIDARHAAGGPARDAALAALAAETPLGRIATEADVANAALWLASDLSAGLTGTLQQVDCGLV